MKNPKISFCCSAIRPEHWMEMYNSLSDTPIEDFELVFVGNVRPNYSLPPNFKYIYSPTKPAQCYEIAFRNATGELIHWTADDATYETKTVERMYNIYKQLNDEKVVLAFRTVEDGRDITEVHRFRGRDMSAPRMAPFGVMSRRLFHELGGYDRRFICGQSENDVVMRVLEIGGRVLITDLPVIVNHEKSHHASGTVFRSGFYKEDRIVLEKMWVKDGVIQTKRLEPVERFEENEILNVTQSQRGNW